METFLGQLAKQILHRYGKQLDHVTVIFPNRRAALFFQQALGRLNKKPVWSPSIFSLEEWIESVTETTIPDRLSLLVEMFQAFKRLDEDAKFDQFYDWGEALLHDFDEIDREDVNAEQLFKRVEEYGQIDTAYLIDPEAFNLFLNAVGKGSTKELQQDFNALWERVGELFRLFKNRLEQKKWGYPGMVYRGLADRLQNGEQILPDERFIFAGFHYFDRSQQRLIKFLIEQNRCELFWDADVYYSENPIQEAGAQLRKMWAAGMPKPAPNELSRQFQNSPKKVTAVGVPLHVGQAKALGQTLTDVIKQAHFKAEETVVILPDTSLLFPLLFSLPDDSPFLNVTMGYSLSQTPLYNLFELLNSLQFGVHPDRSVEKFYYRDAIALLQNPLVYRNDREQILALSNALIARGVFWVTLDDFKYILNENKHKNEEQSEQLEVELPEILPKIFKKVRNLNDFFTYFHQILSIVQSDLIKQTDGKVVLETEYLYQFVTKIKRLEEISRQNALDMKWHSFWKVFRLMIRGTKMPFTGEPLKGLQIMGLMESQCLDFKNVFILSANEGVLPSSTELQSFIPNNLRRAFGLSAPEDREADQAFFFYRLIQRAENIWIGHNTQAGDGKGGEKSRYLLQAEHEWRKANPQISLAFQILNTPAANFATKTISVIKTPEVLASLETYTTRYEGERSKKLSPSALSSYIACKLQFYFRYAANIGELSEMAEDIDAQTFGQLVHKTLEFLYKPFTETIDKQEVTSESLEALLNRIPKAADAAFRSVYGGAFNEVVGFNRLVKTMVIELTQKFLAIDNNETPFKVTNVEHSIINELTLSTNEHLTVRLGGKIDRLDQTTTGQRIIDYKTGKVASKGYDIEKIFSDPVYKNILQGSLYAYLLQKNDRTKPVEAVFYTARPQKPNELKVSITPFADDNAYFEFESRLTQLLVEIFDPQVPFDQTDNEKICEFCDYQRICHRNV